MGDFDKQQIEDETYQTCGMSMNSKFGRDWKVMKEHCKDQQGTYAASRSEEDF